MLFLAAWTATYAAADEIAPAPSPLETRAGQPTAEPPVIPRPAEFTAGPGAFRPTPDTQIFVSSPFPESRQIAETLAEWMRPRTGLKLDVRDMARSDDARGHIVLATARMHSMPPDAYQINITPTGVGLFATGSHGLFHAVQTLRQLYPPEFEHGAAPTAELPAMSIADRPRFAWRGLMLDTTGRMLDKTLIQRCIDLLAYHKMNVLHLRLADDRAWRVEIRKHPKLTEIGASRDGEAPRGEDEHDGGFYSQDDIREVVAYARSRYVTVVPEISLPGHCLAALRAYPHLSCRGGPFPENAERGIQEDVFCAGNDEVFALLEDVFAEVLELFPSEHIHIGGEVFPTTRWVECPRCQDRIKAENLRDAAELHNWFLRRVEPLLTARGRKLIGWDGVLEGGRPAGATVQAARTLNAALAAVRSGHNVVLSPAEFCRLDYPQGPDPAASGWMGLIDLPTLYAMEPIPPALSGEHATRIRGVEALLWTDTAAADRVDWQLFPRLAALAEVAWTPAARREWGDFTARMQVHYRRLDRLGVAYCVPSPEFDAPVTEFDDGAQIRLSPPPIAGNIHVTLDGSEPTAASPAYDGPLHVTDTARIRARTIATDGRASEVAELRVRKVRAHEPVAADDVAPGLAYEYFGGSWRTLPDFDALTPDRSGVVARPDLSVRLSEVNYALRFRGLIEIATDGEYVFHVQSNDGARLWLHDDPVVENDGLQRAATERSGRVRLNAGLHPLTIEYFQTVDSSALRVSYEGPGIERQGLPAHTLFTPDRSAPKPAE